MEVIPHPSPNFGARRDAAKPSLIVLHYTAMTLEGALERLTDPAAEVSAHYLIAADGRIFGLVDEEKRAWHAGAGNWGGISDVNSRSIGIELDNDAASPFTASQTGALCDLLSDIRNRWAIQPECVIAHSDMAPERKGDPGSRFDWQWLAHEGHGVWPSPAEPGDFTADARRFGYPEADEATLLMAFRLRFRPWASGPLDNTDRALIADLAARFPVDRGVLSA